MQTRVPSQRRPPAPPYRTAPPCASASSLQPWHHIPLRVTISENVSLAWRASNVLSSWRPAGVELARRGTIVGSPRLFGAVGWATHRAYDRGAGCDRTARRDSLGGMANRRLV